MKKHIDLDRRFAGFNPDLKGEVDEYGLALSGWGSKSWPEILAEPCTVVVAEAGNGKTAELEYRTHKLRAEGECAFFCRLEVLAKLPLKDALEIGTAAELEAWRQSDRTGYFLLDAVDEARLAEPRDFEIAIRQLVAGLEPHLARARIVISTRPSAWRAYADRSLLEERLAVLLPAPTTDAAVPVGDGGAVVKTAAPMLASDADQKPVKPAISVLQMVPLDRPRVRIFAGAKGIADLDSFMTAIERADADLFATRPADLIGLIDIYKNEGRIGTYRDVVRRNIELKLGEQNTTHQAKTIAPDRALVGAEALAAAVTLTSRTSILLPDAEVDEARKIASIDPQEVLRGWTPSEIQALLGRALFDESLYGTVRFHHRTAREYLAARWLLRLIKQRTNRRAIDGLLFAKPYGCESEVVIPSMKPIVGWLAQWDPRIRDRAFKIDPKVLLEEGDASGLDPGTRGALLKHVAQRYENRRHTPMQVRRREIRRLADPRLGGVVRELLATYPEHEGVSELALRIVAEGPITGCGDLCSAIALSDTASSYSRACAVDAVVNAGTEAEKTAIARAITANPAGFDRRFAAAAIAGLLPGQLDAGGIARILELIEAPESFSHDELQRQTNKLAPRLAPSGQLALLQHLIGLLKRPPHDEGEYRRLSQRHIWLLPIAVELARELLVAKVEGATDAAVLEALSFGEQSRHLSVPGDLHETVAKLVDADRHLKHALFWHLAEATRARESKGLHESWFAHLSPNAGRMDADDVPLLVKAMQERPLEEDKRVALSMLVTIYARVERPPALLAQLRGAVAGDAALEEALQRELTPPPRPEMAALAARMAEDDEKHRIKKEKRAQERLDWVAGLRAAPDKIGDLSIAPQGQVWGNTVYLLEEVRKKRPSQSSWVADGWELLEPEFGPQVAARFRDFCMALWRLWQPRLRSEAGGDSHQVPWSVIIGMSGIAMEARANPSWAESISPDQAVLATRYALHELNGLPGWFADVWGAHQSVVAPILLDEIAWELSAPKESSYVLARARWSAKWLAGDLRDGIVMLVACHKGGGSLGALAEAVGLILREPRPVPPEILSRALAGGAAEGEQALWHAVRLCIDAEQGICELEAWVQQDDALGEQRITAVLEHVFGDSVHGFDSTHRDFMRPQLLARLLKLTHTHVCLADDVSLSGAVTSRHHAQDARGKLLNLLCEIPGRPTYDALLELSDFHAERFPKDRMLVLAERRAEADTERLPRWSESEVAALAAAADVDPSTEEELFKLALSRIDDLKLDLEDGDESVAQLVTRVENEVELRRWVAHQLREAAQARYTTGSEEELADKTRTDVRMHHPAVPVRLPIEIKIAGKWTAKQLRERMENQLVGQYMREASCGVFLVVNRGTKSDRKRWSVAGKQFDFSELVSWLTAEAADLIQASANVKGLEVIGFDLLARAQTAKAKPGKQARKPSRRAAALPRTPSTNKAPPARLAKAGRVRARRPQIATKTSAQPDGAD